MSRPIRWRAWPLNASYNRVDLSGSVQRGQFRSVPFSSCAVNKRLVTSKLWTGRPAPGQLNFPRRTKPCVRSYVRRTTRTIRRTNAHAQVTCPLGSADLRAIALRCCDYSCCCWPTQHGGLQVRRSAIFVRISYSVLVSSAFSFQLSFYRPTLCPKNVHLKYMNNNAEKWLFWFSQGKVATSDK